MTTHILAIIVPAFNEEEVLQDTCQKLSNIVVKLIDQKKISSKSHICIIDDGSHDQTWDLIEKESLSNEFVKGIKLSRNFGHQNAVISGLFTCDADIFVSIDADLQDDEHAIIEMVDHFRSGSHIVYGVRKTRNVDSFFKRSSALLFYKMMSALKVESKFNHADFRLMSRSVVSHLENFKEVNLFLRAIVPLIGFKASIVFYDRRQRLAGTTKYSLRKMVSFAWEGVTSFSTFPLKLITFVGFLVFFLSMGMGFYSLWAKFFGYVLPGWTSTVLPIYFIGGIQLLSIGILGEYLGKIYQEIKGRPRFIIERKTE